LGKGAHTAGVVVLLALCVLAMGCSGPGYFDAYASAPPPSAKPHVMTRPAPAAPAPQIVQSVVKARKPKATGKKKSTRAAALVSRNKKG